MVYGVSWSQRTPKRTPIFLLRYNLGEPALTRPALANGSGLAGLFSRFVKTMKTRYRLIYRGSRGGTYYCVDCKTGKRVSLQTSDEEVAQQLIDARNNAVRQPEMNLQIAQVYLRHGDPALSAHTWQNVMEQIKSTKRTTLFCAGRGQSDLKNYETRRYLRPATRRRTGLHEAGDRHQSRIGSDAGRASTAQAGAPWRF